MAMIKTCKVPTEERTVSGSSVSFNSAFALPLKACKVSFSATQSGSGTPSPSNPRPISGADSIHIQNTCGINQWDEEWEQGSINDSTGEPSASSYYSRSKYFIKVMPNTSYYFYSKTSAQVVMYEYDYNHNYIGLKVATNSVQTTRNNTCSIRIRISGGNYTQGNVSINYPSTDTSYHAFVGQSFTIQIGSTVYGGEYDARTGVLTVTHLGVDLGSLTWTKESNHFYSNILSDAKYPPNNSTLAEILCESYNVIIESNVASEVEDYSIGMSRTGRIYIYDSSLSSGDATAFTTAVTGIKLVYKLATPTTIQLPPCPIETIIGNNTISTDTGTLEITFADLQEKSASGSVATFNTALAMPLASCTSLITGYQEGSGTPSPDNVRPLVGYIQADIVKCGKNLIDISEFARVYPSFCSYNDDVLSVISGAVLFYTGISVYIPSGAIINTKIVEGTATNVRIRLIFSDDTYTDIPILGFPYTTSKDIVSIRLNWSTLGTFEISEFQVELGSTATPYEPYNGNTYTFSFGQSIYQGSIDWKRGVVTTSMGVRVFDGSSDETWRTYSGQRYTVPVSDFTSPSNSQLANIMCDKLETITKAQQGSRTFVISGSDADSHDFMVNVGANSYGDMIAWLNANPITVAYELATPIEIPLGGINLLTQEGQNNIFCDTGDVDLTYKDLDIAKRGNFREVFRLP